MRPSVSEDGRREPVLTPFQHRVPAVEGSAPLKILLEPKSRSFSVTRRTGGLSVSPAIASVVQEKKGLFFPFEQTDVCVQAPETHVAAARGEPS